MSKLPNATYRLQLNSQFTFDDTVAICEYLAALNISHLYLSPYLQAAVGSNHGYDVADFLQVNKELGGEIGRGKLCAALQQYNLSQVIDIVPNHMVAKSPDNSWWTQVLKYGRLSPYAKYFDIYWGSAEKIMLAVLEAEFSEVVAAGKIKLQFVQGNFILQYYENVFPVTPKSLIPLFSRLTKSTSSDSLTKLLLRLNKLSSRQYCAHATKIEQQIIKLIQQTEILQRALELVIDEYNSSIELLSDLHQVQNYQLVFWQNSLTKISYRRFFHLNHLIGLRIEERATFDAANKLVKQWFHDGVVAGIRVDHIDGLRNPLQYLKRLNKAFPKVWTVVEKILSPGEKLAKNWPVAGTTGYDFLNMLTNVLLDSRSEAAFTDFYAELTGQRADYSTVLQAKKFLVLQRLLAGDINYLTEMFQQIAKQHETNFTAEEIRAALQAIVACFPRYRTYLEPATRKISDEDRAVILGAIKAAKNFAPNTNPNLFDFIADILLLKYSGQLVTDFGLRLQQLTGPAMAKGGEDTALYCYNRCIALNEVGSDPSKFGITVAEFHQAMLDANKYFPHSMLATSTHDTKRSEDVRARLVLLSEIATAWFAAVTAWTMHNEKHHAATVLDRNTQYFLYQNLVGVWPITQERFTAYMIKAVREAEVYTSWFFPDKVYEKKLQDFIAAIFTDVQFQALFITFIKPLIEPGRINSMAQVVLKFTAPGVPDIYQGSEIWNYSLVDPDNRLPVDFISRKALFTEMLTLSSEEILLRMDSGMPKLWVTYKILELRKLHPELFNNSTYSPVWLEGEKQQHGIAFLRGSRVLVLVPRLPLTLNGEWGNTWLQIPAGNWVNILTNEDVRGGQISISSLLGKFPVVVLLKK